MGLNRLQELCEAGQRQLMDTQYLEAIQTLKIAEELAFAEADYATLSRLYMPLQEAHRQARQRSAEGIVNLSLLASAAHDLLSPEEILTRFPHGQLLVAGWGSIEPALRLRTLAKESKRYVDTFLAAVFPITGGAISIAVVPLPEVQLPSAEARSIDALIKLLPPHSLIFGPNELPTGSVRGTTETFARVSQMWENLHQPFLAAADMQVDPFRKMDGYRTTIRVDSACELAHQKLAAVAWNLKR